MKITVRTVQSQTDRRLFVVEVFNKFTTIKVALLDTIQRGMEDRREMYVIFGHWGGIQGSRTDGRDANQQKQDFVQWDRLLYYYY